MNPVKYTSIPSGLATLWKEEGPHSLWRGWSGKLFGYGVQGGFKYGIYEYLKSVGSDVFVDCNRNYIFLLSSSVAQLLADVTLSPFEAVKIRVQIHPNFAKGLADGFPLVYKNEGLAGYVASIINHITT